MKKNYITICLVLVVILALIIVSKSYFEPFFDVFELKLLDLRYQLLTKHVQNDKDIVQLLLDDYSVLLSADNPELKLGRIPWPRKTWGTVLNYLNRSAPKAVVFDINFTGKEGLSNDNLSSDGYFAKKIKESKAKVFLGVVYTDSLVTLQNDSSNLERDISDRIYKVSKEIRTLLSAKSLKINTFTNKKSNIIDNITYTVFVPILEDFLKNSYGIGAINSKTDIDGLDRRNAPLYIYNDKFYPSISFAVAHSLLPKTEQSVSLYPDKLVLGNRSIYLDSNGMALTSWYGPPKTYEVYHLIDILLSEDAISKGIKPLLEPDIFRNKIIVVGQSASGVDIHHTPMGNVYVGTEIVATNIDNYLNQKSFLRRLNSLDNIIITAFICLCLAIIVFRSRSIETAILTVVILAILVFVSNTFVMLYYQLWVDLFLPLAFMLITFISVYLMRFIFTSEQLESAIEEATKDGLTKLYNHRFFQEKIQNNLTNASRKDDTLSICIIDIDFFKKFNDTYGHRTGDAVLIQVANTIKDNVRKNDMVARYGGEEMCVILEKTDTEDAIQVAQKLVDSIANKDFLIRDGKEKTKVTISVGLATFPKHGKTVAELIEFADKSLYRAKASGRNQVGSLYDYSNIEESCTKDLEISKEKFKKALSDLLSTSESSKYNPKEYIDNLLSNTINPNIANNNTNQE